MTLFRALSTTKGRRDGYDRLLDETTVDSSGDQDRAVLKRVTSVPASILFGSSSRKPNPQPGHPGNESKSKQKVKKAGKIHPLFSLFEGKGKKNKMTANPDISRYIQYLKEGGL